MIHHTPVRKVRRNRRPSVERMEQRCLLAAYALDAGVLLKNGTATLSVDTYSSPDAADWSGDGKKDLVVGQFTNGNIWLYPNIGTNPAPVFNGRSQMTAGGSVISTSYS